MRARSAAMRRTRHFVAFVGCLSMLAGTSADAQVRLHSASEEAATATLAADFEKARIAHLAALDAHRVYLVDALHRDRTLLVQRELAERDALLTLVISANSRTAGRKLLGDQVDTEWATLAGTLPKPGAYVDFVSAARHLNSLEIERSGLLRNKAALVSLFEAQGGAGKYCDSEGVGSVVFTALGNSDEATAINDTCDELVENSRQIKKEYARAGGASSLIGDPGGGTSGEIGQALTEAREISVLIAAQNQVVSTVAGQVAAMNAYYQCQLGRQDAEQSIRADAVAVQGALDTFAIGDAETVFAPTTFSAAWDTLTSQIIDPDCSRPPAPATPAARAGTTGFSATDILLALGKLDKYAADDALLALVRDSALDVQASALGEALTGLAAQPSEEPDSKTARRAMAALRIFGALDRLYVASEGRLPDTAGILVALADVRMRQATAKIEAARLAELDRLSHLRLAALRQRAVLLADASIQLTADSDAGLNAALRRYSESVNRGAVPSIIIANDMSKGRYLPWIDRERAVVDATYAVLAPAVVQLEAYGKGGLTADTIAQFLQALGLGGIAVK